MWGAGHHRLHATGAFALRGDYDFRKVAVAPSLMHSA
jgi:hypothetical protein